jgi:hypothetical protein
MLSASDLEIIYLQKKCFNCVNPVISGEHNHEKLMFLQLFTASIIPEAAWQIYDGCSAKIWHICCFTIILISTDLFNDTLVLRKAKNDWLRKMGN